MKRNKFVLSVCLFAIVVLFVSFIAYFPVLTKEITTLTITGGLGYTDIVLTLYSNRLLLVDNRATSPFNALNPAYQDIANIFTSRRVYIPKGEYAEILELLKEVEAEETHVTYRQATSGCDITVYCLRYMGYFYYSSAATVDEGVYSISRILNKYENIMKFSESQYDAITVTTNKILAEPVINDDLSLSWVVPDEYSFLIDEKYGTDIVSILKSGTVRYPSSSGFFENTICADDVIRIIASYYPDTVVCIRLTYYKYNADYTKRDEWYLDFDVSDINVAIEGEPPKPGNYTCFNRQWAPESITLAEGYEFKENAYYLLTSYETNVNSPDYGSYSVATFKVLEESNVYYTSYEPGKYTFRGFVIIGEIYIREATVRGDAASGLTLVMTPESTKCFKIKESPRVE